VPADPRDRRSLRDGLLVGGGVVVGVIGGAVGFWALGKFVGPPGAPPPKAAKVAPPRVEVASAPVAVLWSGPVSRDQAAGAELPGVPSFFLPCKGDGNPSCGQIADGWRDASGRKLPEMRRKLKIPDGPIVLAAFSAGGGVVRRLLQDPRDRAEIAGVVLADGTYTTTWKDKKARTASPIAEFVLWGRDVQLNAGRLFVATASASPNSGSTGKENYPSGAETLAAIAAELALPTVPAQEGLPAPARAWGSGSVLLLDYARSFEHGAHATELARQVWAAIVVPHFARQASA
jgi:hypothetical protein